MVHTHLLRTIFANSDVECILHAKTLQLYLTGMGRWKDPRNEREDTIAKINARWNKLTDCDNSAAKCKKRLGGSWVEPLPIITLWKLDGSKPWTTGNHNNAGTPDWPSLVSPSVVSVFVGRRLSMTLLPPALKWILKLKTAVEVDKASRREKNENKTKSQNRHHQVEVWHLFRCSTHTLIWVDLNFIRWSVGKRWLTSSWTPPRK